MNQLVRLIGCILLLAVAVAGCSLPSERAFTRQDIFKTNIFTYFTIKESPDSVLAAINREGEVVIEGVDKTKRSYFIKIMSSGKELKTTYVEK
jgi:hypothetical protein